MLSILKDISVDRIAVFKGLLGLRIFWNLKELRLPANREIRSDSSMQYMKVRVAWVQLPLGVAFY